MESTPTDIVTELDEWRDEVYRRLATTGFLDRARDEIVRLTEAEDVLFQQLEACMKRAGKARADTLDQVAENLKSLTPMFPQIGVALTVIRKMREGP